ncbi:MAG: hypothetical protein U9R25_07735 [Chloroflexota bacterium]|nr:hypothetical protein [Chloroflexota bacterium]
MANKRIQVYTDEGLKRRIVLAAVRRDVAVTQYCLEAIMQQLAEDDMLEIEQIEIPVVQRKQDNHLMRDLRALREEILLSRGGKPIELDIVALVSEERDDELLGLR